MLLSQLANALKLKSKTDNPDVEFIVVTKEGRIIAMDIKAKATDMIKALNLMAPGK